MYSVASRVRQSRGISFETIFFAQINSESSKTYRKLLLNCFSIFFEKIFIWDLEKFRNFHVFRSLDIATLVHHCSQSSCSNTITKWLGTIVHLHVEKVQLQLFSRNKISRPLLLQEGGLPTTLAVL